MHCGLQGKRVVFRFLEILEIGNKEDLVAIALMSEIPDWGSKTKNGIILGAAKQLIPFVLVPVALTQSAPAMVIVDAKPVSQKMWCGALSMLYLLTLVYLIDMLPFLFFFENIF